MKPNWVKKPILYTSPGYWDIHGRNKVTKQFDTKWAYYTLWVAHYFKTYQAGVTKPSELQPWKSAGKTWTFWQYTQNGDGPSYGAESKSIDLNWFNGSLDELYKYAKVGSTTTSSTTTTTPQSTLDIDSLKSKVNSAIDSWAKTQKRFLK